MIRTWEQVLGSVKIFSSISHHKKRLSVKFASTIVTTCKNFFDGKWFIFRRSFTIACVSKKTPRSRAVGQTRAKRRFALCASPSRQGRALTDISWYGADGGADSRCARGWPRPSPCSQAGGSRADLIRRAAAVPSAPRRPRSIASASAAPCEGEAQHHRRRRIVPTGRRGYHHDVRRAEPWISSSSPRVPSPASLRGSCRWSR